MISLADIRYGNSTEREPPGAVAFTMNGAAPSLTRVAVPPIEQRDPGGAVSGKPPHMASEQDEGSRSQSAPEEAPSETASGCGWKLTYESELNRVFLDLVERDTNALVIRIPRESLVKFLRSASDFVPAPPRRTGGRCDTVA